VFSLAHLFFFKLLVYFEAKNERLWSTHSYQSIHNIYIMVVIRRMVDSKQSYTAIFLPGEEARVFPTTEYEHFRILQIYKQDKNYIGIHNDFTDMDFGTSKPQ